MDSSKDTQTIIKTNNYSFILKSLLIIQLLLLFNFICKNYHNTHKVDSITIDIVYKYIDLRDNEINREGLEQKEKDYDNEELKYSLRSVFKNLEWINKIYIIMPNNNVSFINKKKDSENRIIYIKDKDILGFDSSSSITFEHNALYKLYKYNVSEYFIYFCDDYFVNKKLRKRDFFYSSKKEGRIVPYVMNNNLKLSDNVYYKYYNYFIKHKHKLKEECKQTYKDYWFQTCLSYLLLYKYFNNTSILLPSSFDDNWHNALPLTLSDLKEIHKMEEEEYEYKEELFNSKHRTNKQITFESVYSYYFFNKYERKLGRVKGKNINIKNVKKELKKDYDVFCINTGPERLKGKIIQNEKKVMEELFFKQNFFET